MFNPTFASFSATLAPTPDKELRGIADKSCDITRLTTVIDIVYSSILLDFCTGQSERADERFG